MFCKNCGTEDICGGNYCRKCGVTIRPPVGPHGDLADFDHRIWMGFLAALGIGVLVLIFTYGN